MSARAPPGALIKYQIATYLCCNPQDAFNKVEDPSWEGQSRLQSPNGYYDLYMSQSFAVLYWCPLTLFNGHSNLEMSQSLLQCSTGGPVTFAAPKWLL